MSDIAIRVENLSKLYTIGRAQQRHDTLRDSIADFRLKIADSLRPRHLQSSISNLQSPGDLWALRDVSFEVKRAGRPPARAAGICHDVRGSPIVWIFV